MTIVDVKARVADKNQEKKYTPDLSGFIGQCERNYILLSKLFNTNNEKNSWHFNILETHLVSHLIQIDIIEKCTYTTSVRIKQITKNKITNKKRPYKNIMAKEVEGEASASGISLDPEMYVRLYHDARMAEVLSYHSVGKVNPSYTYPNKKMHQKNEKAVWNSFLSEWLTHCIKKGYVASL